MTSGRTRALLVIAALVAAAVGQGTAAARPSSSGRSSSPVALAGTTTISGSNTGYVDVLVPRTARLGDPLFEQRRSSVKVLGGGRTVGFALVPDDTETGTPIIGARFGFTDRIGATAGVPLLVGGTTDPASGFDRLVRAGRYRLYLLTDRRLASVTLRLTGLDGDESLTPETPAQLVLGGQRP